MKRLIICALLLLCLVSCDKEDKKNYKEELISYSSKLDEYQLKARMNVVKDEGESSFEIVVNYLAFLPFEITLLIQLTFFPR